VTRQEIRDISRKRLGETTSAFWTDTELNLYINLGCSDIAWRIKCLRANSTAISVVSCDENIVAEASNEVAISTYLPTFYAINEVYLKRESEDYRRLIPTTREELDILDSTWQSLVGYTYTDPGSGITTYNKDSATAEPTHYYWDREEDVFGVYPPANDVNDGANLKIYYSKKHADLSSDDAEPQLPSGIQIAVVDYVVATGLEDRGWGDRANDQWNKYMTKLKDYQTEKKREREDDFTQMKNYRNI